MSYSCRPGIPELVSLDAKVLVSLAALIQLQLGSTLQLQEAMAATNH